MAEPNQTVVQIKEVELVGSGVRTVVVHRGGPSASHPIAPASLWDGTDDPVRVLDLHRLVDQGDGELSLLTFDWNEKLPLAGQEFVFQSWWSAAQWDLVADASLTWRRTRFSHDHDHCKITWKTLNYRDDAYVSTNGDWLSTEAYNTFIRDDVLRLRSSQAE